MAQWENLGHVYLAADGSQSGSISTTSEKIFTSLQLVTQGSDLEMLGVVISFEDGDKFSPSINHFFTEGTRSLVVDLPTGNTRKVSGVEIRYSKLADGAWCNVELFGK
ncbi:MAG: hypothetical protein IT462_17355 [Planctomycetes bacterium]|nr:hypothetical protein [Planctomycetota bacterium]